MKSKSNIAFLLALVVLAGIGWYSLQESGRQVERDRLVSGAHDVLETSASLRSHLENATAARRDYIRSGDPTQVEICESMADTTLADLVNLRRITIENPDQYRRLDKLEPLLRSRLAWLRSSVEMHRQHPEDRTLTDANAAQMPQLVAQIVDQINQFDEIEKELLQQRSAEALANSLRSARTSEVLTISTCLVLIMALVVFNIELSRRTQAESVVTEQRNLLDSILNSCSDAVVVADRSGKIVLRNPAVTRNLPTPPPGTPAREIPRLLGFFKPDGVSLYAFEDLPLPRTLRGETVNGLEICVRPPGEKESQWLLAAGTPLLVQNAESGGGVVFLRNITNLKQADERLQKALREAEANAREKNELTKLADLLQSCQILEEACKIAGDILSSFFDARPGALFLINPSSNLLEAKAIWNECSTTEHAFSAENCWALRLKKVYDGGASGAHLRCSHLSTGFTGTPVCVPLLAQEEILGVLYIQVGRATPGEREEFLRRADAVAERLSLALSNLKLREVLRNQSIRDPLTGLFNRRYLEESLMREIQRAARKARTITVIMLDLDHYKLFNDTFGHQAGDMLLQEIAAVFNAHVRASDLVCRYGGEEFAIILSEVDAAGARICVETLRQEIKRLSLEYRGQSLSSVTVSAGIAEFPSHGQTPEDLVRAADAALYQAKREGRDRVVICEQATDPMIAPRI